MNVKNFIVGGIIGGIVDYLLGWLFYGIVFNENFGGKQPENMMFIALGSLTFGMFVSYIFVRWAHISTLATGLQAGAVIALFSALLNIFFGNAMEVNPNYQLLSLDLGIMLVMGACVGAVVAMVNGKMK